MTKEQKIKKLESNGYELYGYEYDYDAQAERDKLKRKYPKAKVRLLREKSDTIGMKMYSIWTKNLGGK